MIVHALAGAPFWLAVAGVASAWYLYIKRPEVPARIAERFRALHGFLERKYGLDELNQFLFAGGAIWFGMDPVRIARRERQGEVTDPGADIRHHDIYQRHSFLSRKRTMNSR